MISVAKKIKFLVSGFWFQVIIWWRWRFKPHKASAAAGTHLHGLQVRHRPHGNDHDPQVNREP
jgi:hypothetical protein